MLWYHIQVACERVHLIKQDDTWSLKNEQHIKSNEVLVNLNENVL